jgi:hypothetical protein
VTSLGFPYIFQLQDSHNVTVTSGSSSSLIAPWPRILSDLRRTNPSHFASEVHRIYSDVLPFLRYILHYRHLQQFRSHEYGHLEYIISECIYKLTQTSVGFSRYQCFVPIIRPVIFEIERPASPRRLGLSPRPIRTT